ncbi:hypothetical protein AWZ03_005028 [Drosophila navojoa]|uniref:Uncharacterized protein n=1 Tax=Drosophila navojoa TaxID=7232 RepID=A0A484BIH0_DRONA|nr:hypothetical protein AWZ03_005028 [Drosophila navojoa]
MLCPCAHTQCHGSTIVAPWYHVHGSAPSPKQERQQQQQQQQLVNAAKMLFPHGLICEILIRACIRSSFTRSSYTKRPTPPSSPPPPPP